MVQDGTDAADECGVGRASVVVASLLVLSSLAACSEDKAAAAVSQDQYDEAATRLCEQHGPVLAEAYDEVRPDSDAEEAAYYLSDYVPRARAVISELAGDGFPPDKAEAYTTALNDALAALDELATQPYRYIDQRHARTVAPDDDLLVRVRHDFESADIPC
jgi:hypothetical protein